MAASMKRGRMSESTNSVSLINKVRPYVEFINAAAGLYLLWVAIHYVAAQLYVYYCTPLTFMGFIMSPLMVAAPHCYTFRWCITNGANNISTMWVVFGTWIASKFAILVTNRPVAP
jgi:hypothetical protein